MITIYSSHGEVYVDAATGNVIDRHVDSDEANNDVVIMAQVDFDEYRAYYGVTDVPDTLDILDVAFVTLDGQLVPAEAGWRLEHRPRNPAEVRAAEMVLFRSEMQSRMKLRYGLDPNDYDLDESLAQRFYSFKNGQSVAEQCNEIADKYDLDLITG